ncbi:MAG: hypothetical protein K2N30_00280 [Clostridia bacterium]|nr:hypothetical protein [Clostridia bacterium]
MNDDEKLDISLEAAPTLGGEEDKYEANTGKPYEEYSKEPLVDIPEQIIIPEEAKQRASGSRGLLLGILAAVVLLGAAAVFAFCGEYVGSAVCAGWFVIFVTAFITVLCVKEKNALSGKYVLGREGTRRIEARVKYSALHSTTTKRIGSRGRYVNTVTTGAVYKVTLFAEGREFTALSRNYYEQNQTVFAYVNGKHAFIDENEK